MKVHINIFLEKNKSSIVDLLSKIIKIKSYSGKENDLSTFIIKYISSKKLKKYVKIKRIHDNVIILCSTKNSNIKFLFDAHLDTVPAENTKNWKYSPFGGKVIDDRIYGRGSCDDKGSIVALIFTLLYLNQLFDQPLPIAFSFSAQEENSSGKGIEEVLKYIKTENCIICEPSDLKIIYGHKGKWNIKVTFYGKSAHSSTPQLGINAIKEAYPLLENLFTSKNKNFKVSPLGEPIYTITFMETKTNSLNSIPNECSIYIDYRSVLGENELTVKNFILNKIKGNYRFVPQHKFFKAWILDTNSALLKTATQTFKNIYKKEPKPLLWQFCTNGSITMAKHNIPTIGFGPGNPFLAHQDNEYIKLGDLLESIKFYSYLTLHHIK